MLSKNLKLDPYSRAESYSPSLNSYLSSSTSQASSTKFSPAAKIKVFGLGGAGCNVVRRMIEVGVESVDFWAMNTDLQVLKTIHADGIVQLGSSITRGLGAGMAPEIGKQAAEECTDELEAALTGADMVFITAGMGGGTGTGAAPVVAEIAKRLGILTIAVVTKPFNFEGAKRRQLAEDGIEKLKQTADAVLVVPNEKLLQLVDKRTSLAEAFRISDEVLRQAVQGISNIINKPGDINTDFADVRAVMSNAGTALMGMGRATGENGAVAAAIQAVESPLIELSIEGAKGVLINIEGGKNLTLFDVSEAASSIQNIVDPEAKIIFGFSIDESLNDEVRVTVIATGFTGDKLLENEPDISRGNNSQSKNADHNPYPFPAQQRDPNNNAARQQASSSYNNIVDFRVSNNRNQNSNSLPAENPNNYQNRNQENQEYPENLEIPTFLRNRVRKNDNYK